MLHLHVAESPHERELMQRRAGTTTVQHLEQLGFFDGNRVLGAHSLLLDDADLQILGRNDFHAVICATGKMNRGQGIADLPRLLGAGINVCLGTDGSASDNLDVLMGMKVTYIAQNHLHEKVYALPPETILEMATDERRARAELGDGAARAGPAGGFHPGRLATASPAAADHEPEVQRALQPRLLRHRRRRGHGRSSTERWSWRAAEVSTLDEDEVSDPPTGTRPATCGSERRTERQAERAARRSRAKRGGPGFAGPGPQDSSGGFARSDG